MNLTIEIELGNERMQTPSDVNQAVGKSIQRTAPLFEPLATGDGGAIMDENGNTVGRWVVQS